MTKILICDDEPDIVNALKIYLESDGYEVLCAANGSEVLDILRREDIKLLVMDIMMPVMDGISATRRIRTESAVPIILLTAKSEDADIIHGLNSGADDYITKPFKPMELNARVRSQLRRYMRLGGDANAAEGCISIGAITLDDKAKRVSVDDAEISLTPTEYDILKFLMQHPHEVFSPKELYHRVWKEAPLGAENTVAVHIRHIREKIEIDPAAPRYILAVWGQGYKFEGEKR